MNIKENNKLYFDYLKTLKDVDIKTFLNEFSALKDYSDREDYLKNCYSPLLFDILINEDFLKCFYVDSQAKYIFDILKIDNSYFDILKTLVYTYNTNARAFIKAQELKDFENKMTQEGFIKISPSQEELTGKKVLCYTDIMKIDLLDSNLKKELIEGTLLYSDYQKSLMILPKRKRTRGFLIRDNAYIKEIK